MHYDLKKIRQLPLFQQSIIQDIVGDIFEHLDERALNEVFSGYQSDVDMLLGQFTVATNDALYAKSPEGIDLDEFHYLKNLTNDLDESLKKLVLNYFIITSLPDFEMNWHHIEWGILYQLYQRLSLIASRGGGKSYFFAKAVPLWHLYRYSRNIVLKNPKLGLHHSKKGLIITAEDKLARGHMDEIMTEIETNPILRKALYPESNRDKKWGSDLIRTKIGSQLEKRSYGSKMRGLHPGWIVVDDFLTDATLYSIDQREKYIEIFNAVVLHLLEPGGQITIIGTPFHELDLYANIKKRSNWATFEYPAIFPDGTLLWPSKFSLKELMNKLHDGSLTFTREILVKPISSESSIFRFEHIKRSYEGMDKYTLVNNIESHPQKFEDVVIGTDFAISGATKADKTSFVVLGTIGKTIWILHIFSKKGMSYGEQIEKLKQLNTDFRPTKIIIEANGMQKIFYQMGIDEGLPVVEHFTGVNKFSLEKGLPALSILYEQYRIKSPRGNDESRGKTDTIAQGLMGFTFAGEKLESTSHTADEVMALWQGVIGVNYTGNGFDFSFI